MRYPIATCDHCAAQFLDDVSLMNHIEIEHNSEQQQLPEKQRSKRHKRSEAATSHENPAEPENYALSDFLQVKILYWL